MTTNAKQHLLMGRLFTIVAEFPDNVTGTADANEYMEKFDGIGVLEVIDGRIILADCADKGVMARYQWWRLTWADGITRDVWAASEARARALGEDLMEHEFFSHGEITCAEPTGT